MTEAQQALKTMTDKISKIAGRQVEITIRGPKEFTFSFEGKDEQAAQNLADFFEGQATVKVEYDAEIDMTCVFIN